MWILYILLNGAVGDHCGLMHMDTDTSGGVIISVYVRDLLLYTSVCSVDSAVRREMRFLPSCPCRCLVENRSEGSLYSCTAVLGWGAPGPVGGGQTVT